MPYRISPLVTDQYYHVFNRGVAKQALFTNKREYERFIATFSYYRFSHVPYKLSHMLTLPSVERATLLQNLPSTSAQRVYMLAFVLMPNHFHFLLQQKEDDGITSFLRRVNNSYSKYYNTKHDRIGPLIQGPFKAVRIETDEQLIHVSRYIHLNPVVSYIVKEHELFSYPWSSLKEYMDEPIIVNPEPVLSQFSSKKSYKSFLLDQIDYGKKLEEIKHLSFKED